MEHFDIIIIGGGAAGFFSAITAAEYNSNLKIAILEQSKEVLNKVRVSGGGRCNVTHACFDPRTLVTYYPRGARELLGPFHTFGPGETVEWFSDRGVSIKDESDGRMFPESNSSETIIHCFNELVTKYQIQVKTGTKDKDFRIRETVDNGYEVITELATYFCRKLMITSGSSPFIWKMLQRHGYEIVAPVPSLFTFNLGNHPICKLMGLSVNHVSVRIKEAKIHTEGPILITHWGLSGPAILKASAWGAVHLAECDHRFDVYVDWLPKISVQQIEAMRAAEARKKVLSNNIGAIPMRLWQFLLETVITDHNKNWASLSKTEMTGIISALKESRFSVTGKTTFKEEFVTAGGVALSHINFKRFESKKHPGLFMAGEVLNIDAVTGGFNFQAAWTGGHIAGLCMGED